jgi:hypothetical protein
MTTTPYRPEAKENNLVDSYSQVGSVVARNTVIFDENGNAITLLSKDDVLDCYQTSDIDEASATVTYIGKIDRAGNWFIQKIDQTSGISMRFIKGTSAYTTNWTNRASLSYDYFNVVF